jgi:peptidoglycan-N-acetylglucosamine deacetylase
MKIAAVAFVGVLALSYGTLQLSRATTYQLFGEIVPRVETQKKVVALTFDDGPSPQLGGVLQTLREKHVRATFFLIGGGIAEDPQDAKLIVAEGHQVGNHSYSHRRMMFKSQGFIAHDIEETDALIRQAGYTGEIQFRAPYGKKLVGLPWYLAQHHRKHITWDVAPDSNPKIDGHTDRIIADVFARTRPGSIILLHPNYKSRTATRAAISPIIDGLRARGYEFVTVNELLKE